MLGAHKSTLDSKNRMNIPVKLRETIGNSFILAKSIESKCIKVYSYNEWQKTMEKINNMPSVQSQPLRRYLCGSAYEVTCDKQGRISVNADLIKYAGLTEDISVVGTDIGAEIWDKDAWDAYMDSINNDDMRSLAIDLGL